MLALLRRASFWPPSMVHISVINTQTLQITKIPPLIKERTLVSSYSNSNNPVTYFHWKILTLAGIWTRYLTGTKPICYQLSYPGLDSIVGLTLVRGNVSGMDGLHYHLRIAIKWVCLTVIVALGFSWPLNRKCLCFCRHLEYLL